MTSSDFTELRAKYQAAGQGHVFTFWETLDDVQRQSLLKQLELINIDQVAQIVSEVLSDDPDVIASPIEKIHPFQAINGLPASSTASVLDASPDQIRQWYDLGLDLISQNKVGVVLLAGGQGTRLGSSEPKGCYNVGLPSGKSLFQLQAERIEKLTELAQATSPNGPKVEIPWYIMTSGPTRKDTEEFFKKHNFFGLDSNNIYFFEQGVLPCLTGEGKIILENQYSVALAPDGNGGIYNALNKSGVLADIKRRGIEHIHTYCVDNSLVKVADPVFIGFSSNRKVAIATKVVRKRDAHESVGLIVSVNNAPAVLEYSEISPELASAAEEGNPNLLKLRAANIVNHYYSAKFLLNIPNWATSYLPFHKANKKIPHVDLKTGEIVAKPLKPNGIKLEQFVFDVFPRLGFKEFASLEVNRQEEFSPLKNGPGSKVDCPETSRHDLLAQGRRWLESAGAVLDNDQVVEVSPLTSYGGEGLDKFKSVNITTEIL